MILKKDAENSVEATPKGSTKPHLTAGQQSVLDALQHQPQPLSAQALHGLMRCQQPIGLATIYRALDALKLLGLVQHRVTLTGETLYSAVKHDHHYLTCLQCGVSVPVDTCPVKELEAHLQGARSFRIYYHTLEFFGVCDRCEA
ncbi:transcriptional repressor [Nodosilinea sp. LEGE 07298]|uniref:Fur family transcriptional regulator n=1 Tax=Nodosilinea sp. LEGE 07298 TaxID=2777970 RepID=UPI00187F5273|nr:Fur family transcriptional regulator [Nodosilinea sp. LEGE 07298]MBE9113675.1 transcriptional repressor [Nodosilinea sp. LEGE 07298]